MKAIRKSLKVPWLRPNFKVNDFVRYLGFGLGRGLIPVALTLMSACAAKNRIDAAIPTAPLVASSSRPKAKAAPIASPKPTPSNLLSCVYSNQKGERVKSPCATESESGLKIDETNLAEMQFNPQSLTSIQIEDSCYWVRRSGEIRQAFCYEGQADEFSNGLARVIDQNQKMGLMDTNLKIRLPPVYDFISVENFNYRFACSGCRSVAVGEHSIYEGGHWYILDRFGLVTKDCGSKKPPVECKFNE